MKPWRFKALSLKLLYLVLCQSSGVHVKYQFQRHHQILLSRKYLVESRSIWDCSLQIDVMETDASRFPSSRNLRENLKELIPRYSLWCFYFHGHLQNRSAAAAATSSAASNSLLEEGTSGAAGSSTGNGGGLFNLIDTSLSAAPANMPDPWSNIVSSTAPTAIATPPAFTGTNAITNNIHSNVFIASTTSPFDVTAYPQQSLNNANNKQLSLTESPWDPKGTTFKQSPWHWF